MTQRPPVSIEALLEHRVFLRHLAMRLAAGDSHLADDAMQETWLRSLERPPRRSEALRGWLARVLRNVLTSQRRSRARREAHESRCEVSQKDRDPQEALVRQEVIARLLEALVALDEPFRQVVLLRYYENLPPRRIAQILGVPVETVRSRTKRALARLRERLDASDLGEWRALFLPLPAMLSKAPARVEPHVAASSKSLAPVFVAAASVVAVITLGVLWHLEARGVEERESGPASMESLAIQEPGSKTQARPVSASFAIERVDSPEKKLSAPAPEITSSAREPQLKVTASDAPVASAPSAEASGEAGVICGRILDEQGEPIANALITIREVSAGGDRGFSRRRDLSTGTIPVDLGGHFEWTAPDGKSGWELRAVVEESGYVAHWIHESVRPEATAVLDDIVLRRAGTIRGRVIGTDRAPISGAVIQLTDAQPIDDEARARGCGAESWIRLLDRTFSDVRALTDEQGEFVLDHVDPGDWRVWAVSAGTEYDFSEAFELAAGEEIHVELELPPLDETRILRGQVLRADGSPAVGARGWISEKPGRKGRRRSLSFRDEGRFAAYSRDLSVVWVEAEEGGRTTPLLALPFGQSVTLELDERDTLDIVVKDDQGDPIEDLAVLVLSPAIEEPIPPFVLPIERSGNVTWASEVQPDFARAEKGTFEGGRCQLLVPEGSVRLIVEAPGYGRADLRCDPAAEESPFVITLEPLAGVQGSVRSIAGPVEGATVSLTRACERPWHLDAAFLSFRDMTSEVEAASTGDGRFAIAPKGAGTYYLRVESDGFAPYDVGPFELGEEDLEEVDVLLTSGGMIEGRVVLPEGEASVVWVKASRGDGILRTAKVAPDGSYRLSNLTPGRWRLLVVDVPGRSQSSSGFDLADGYDSAVDHPHLVRDGEVTRVDLEPFEHSIQLRGELPLELQDRVQSAVLLQQSGKNLNSFRRFGWKMWAEPDAEGRFDLQALEPGEYRLEVGSRRGNSLAPAGRPPMRYQVTLHLSPGPHTWSLGAGGRLEATVDVGIDPAELRVVHGWKGPGDASCWIDGELSRDGAFELAWVPAGAGIVRVILDRQVIREVAVDVAAGATSRLRIE